MPLSAALQVRIVVMLCTTAQSTAIKVSVDDESVGELAPIRVESELSTALDFDERGGAELAKGFNGHRVRRHVGAASRSPSSCSGLQIKKKVFGEEHANVATCYNNMGNVLRKQGKHEAAMEQYEAALQIYKKMCGADSAIYSSALLNLASKACVTKSSLRDTYRFAELHRIVDVDAELFNSISPLVFAFGLRDHIVLLRLTARFGQRTGETMALEQWRTNLQRLINVSRLHELVGVGRFASLTVCESEQLLAALRASASPCALREATGAREQLLSSLFIDEAGAHKEQMRAVAAHSLTLLGLDGLERVDDDLVAQLMRARARAGGAAALRR